jgi:hypothetical protein
MSETRVRVRLDERERLNIGNKAKGVELSRPLWKALECNSAKQRAHRPFHAGWALAKCAPPPVPLLIAAVRCPALLQLEAVVRRLLWLTSQDATNRVLVFSTWKDGLELIRQEQQAVCCGSSL